MEGVTVLCGVKELGRFSHIDPNTTDTQLQKMLQDGLCGKGSIFCSCCIGQITFRIRRDCTHIISVWPQKDGVDIELFFANIADVIKVITMTFRMTFKIVFRSKFTPTLVANEFFIFS